MNEDELQYGLQAAIDAVERHGLTFEEIAFHGFDHRAVMREVLSRNEQDMTKVGATDSERSTYERVLGEFYALMIRTEEQGVKGVDTAIARTTLNAAVRAATAAEETKENLRDLARSAEAAQLNVDKKLHEGAQRASDYEIDSRRNRMQRRSDLIVPSFLGRASETLHVDWREKVEEKLKKIAAICAQWPAFSSLGSAISGLDLDVTYESIRTRISLLELDPLRDALRDARLAVGYVHAGSYGRTAVAAEQALKWLDEQCLQPEYEWFVPLLGAWGSGKSRVLYEIARQARTKNEYVVYLVPDGTRSLSELLRRKVSSDWDRQMASVNEIERALSQALQSRLTVIVDDFEEHIRGRPGAVRELVDVLGRHTDSPHIRWVVSMDSTRLDLLTSPEHRDVWRQYGIAAKQDGRSTIDGWWNLDETNIEDRLGISLLRSHATEFDDKTLERIEREAAGFEFAGRFFCDPLPAWLHIESRDRGIGELNNLSAMAAYWEQKKKNLASKGPRERDIGLVAATIARLLSKDLPLEVSFRSIANALGTGSPSGAHPDEREIDEVTRAFANGGLLIINDDTGAIVPKVEILWSYMIAANLTTSLIRGASDSSVIIEKLTPWQRRSDKGEWLAESVVQFSLQMMQFAGDGSLGRELWKNWFSRNWLSNLPLWAAAINSDPAAQSDLALRVNTNPPQISSRHELYIFMRFLALTSDTTMTAQERIAAIQPHYSAVGRAGLGSYLVYLVRRSLSVAELSKGSDVLALLNGLVGVEASGAMEEVVRLVVDAGEKTYADDLDRWLFRVGAFLSSENGANSSRHPVPKEPYRKGKPSAGHKSKAIRSEFFWQSLVQTAVASLVQDKELGAFKIFNAAGWMRDIKRTRMPHHVAKEVRHAVNTNLGGVFRRNNRTTREEFIALLSNLSVGNGCDASENDQRERAFFILRHTRPTTDETELKIDPSLHLLLLDLARNPTLRRKYPHYIDPMLRANGLT
ncbi:hypothetical protein AB0O52_23220 [Arthrobacter sp. NPDC080073]|uniref:hypothetical protein n=1 Tax=Arthrobacter sp. NPDC080073 TaxID=3155919 RepID=UPI003424420A